jgi:hypothetical protein
MGLLVQVGGSDDGSTDAMRSDSGELRGIGGTMWGWSASGGKILRQILKSQEFKIVRIKVKKVISGQTGHRFFLFAPISPPAFVLMVNEFNFH